MYTIIHRTDIGAKRPMKITDERGKTVATSTTFDKATADVRRRHEGEKK